MFAHLWILCREVQRGGDEEDVIAAGDGVVEAAFFVHVGAEDRQRSKLLQALEVGVLLHVIWGFRNQSWSILGMGGWDSQITITSQPPSIRNINRKSIYSSLPDSRPLPRARSSRQRRADARQTICREQLSAKSRRQNIYRQRILYREPLSAKHLPRVMARLSANSSSRQTGAP